MMCFKFWFFQGKENNMIEIFKSALAGVGHFLGFIWHLFTNLIVPKTSSYNNFYAYLWLTLSMMFKATLLAIVVIASVIFLAVNLAKGISVILGI